MFYLWVMFSNKFTTVMGNVLPMGNAVGNN